MSRYPALSGKQLLLALQRMGFELIRVRGSHYFLRNMIGPGLLNSILRQVQISRKELFEQL